MFLPFYEVMDYHDLSTKLYSQWGHHVPVYSPVGQTLLKVLFHVLFILHLQSDLIWSQSRDLNPGPPNTKQPLCLMGNTTAPLKMHISCKKLNVLARLIVSWNKFVFCSTFIIYIIIFICCNFLKMNSLTIK